MATRNASCHGGQLRLEVAGDPFAVSICHCLACQRRTGSAFGMQAGFKPDQVQVSGRFGDYARISDEVDRKEHVFHFCPDCGSQVFYTEPTEPDLVVVSVGAFADPSFPPPTESGYDSRRHPWVGLPDSIQRHAPELWDPVRPLHEDGRYAEEHLGRAIEMWVGSREMAKEDSDFDPIRGEPDFAKLVER
ncbi:MAG TPA: GFA family protein [Gaiellaceae bacterium]|nr:GFA family protein [Gaiellaceae bacterium]